MGALRNSLRRRLGIGFIAAAVFLTALMGAWVPRISQAASDTFTVCLQAGHSPSSCGVGNNQNGVKESVLNEQVTKKTYEALKARGINVLLVNPITVDSSLPSVIKAPPADNKQYSFYSPEPAMLTALTWPERFDASLKRQADLVISLHHNAYSNTGIRGYEIYYASTAGGDYGRTEEDVTGSRRFAELVGQEFAKGFHVPARNPAVRENSTNNALTKCAPMPCVLIEAGYMSNTADLAACMNETNQDSMANKIADAVVAYKSKYWTPAQISYPDIRTSALTATYSPDSDTISVSTTLAPKESVSGATMKVWPIASGEGAAKTYSMNNKGDGSFSARIGLEPFGYVSGQYQVSIQGIDLQGRPQLSGTTTVWVGSPSGIISAESIAAKPVTVTSNVGALTAVGVSAPGGVSKVQFAVWSEEGGQDDLKWYDAAQKDDKWVATMHTTDHKDRPGKYIVHAYATDVRGQQAYVGETTVTFAHKEGDLPELYGELTYRKVGNRLVLTANDVRDASGVKEVRFAFWSNSSGQKDLRWYRASKSEQNWSVVIDLADHKCDDSWYTVHVYATDTKDNDGKIADLTFRVEADTVPPTAKRVNMVDLGDGTARVYVEGVTDNESGVSGVEIAAWTLKDGQDDLKWYRAHLASDGTWQAVVPSIEHNAERGPYLIHAYATDVSGNRDVVAQMSFTFTSAADTTPPSGGTLQADRSEYTGQLAKMTVRGVQDPSGIAAVRIKVSRSGSDSIKTYTAAAGPDETWTATFNWGNDFTQAGTYLIEAYAADRAGNEGKVGSVTVTVTQTAIGGTPIMGRSSCSVAQLVNMQLEAGWSNSWYGMTVEEFCRMYYDICQQEGVRAEIAYAQMMHETASLRYGNLVARDQNNFAGLGATGLEVLPQDRKSNHRYTEDGRDAGIVFSSTENGVRSQIQHLKGYASTADLVLPKAPEYDRFGYMQRGCAPTIEQLSQKWATDAGYGDQIYEYVDRILEMGTTMPDYDRAVPVSAAA